MTDKQEEVVCEIQQRVLFRILTGFPNARRRHRWRAGITILRLECMYLVRPWGVEPQSTEPESVILSIELRAQDVNVFATEVFILYNIDSGAKVIKNLYICKTH